LTLSLVYMMFAAGFTLVFGIMGLLNFPHGAIYAFGAYIVFYTLDTLGSSLGSFVLAIILAIVLCTLIGILIEVFFYRRFFGQINQQISIALGLNLIFTGLILVIAGAKGKPIRPLISGSMDIGGVHFSYSRLVIMLISLIVMIGLVLFIKKTKMGLFMRAVSEDSWAASLQGVKSSRVSIFSLGLSCALAGFAGASVMAFLNIATPYMGGAVLSTALLVVMIGGLGSIPGAIFGSLILGLSESFLTTYLGSGVLTLLLGFLMVYILLIIRPQGLMGHE
jgi:branched-chain amino acid transport system permease protein